MSFKNLEGQLAR